MSRLSFHLLLLLSVLPIPALAQEIQLGAMPSSVRETTASPIHCGQTVNGGWTTSDNLWYGIVNGSAFLGSVQTWDLTGVAAGTVIALDYKSSDITPTSDLILGIYFPPDGSEYQYFQNSGNFTLVLPRSGLYKIGTGGDPGAHYSLRLSCSSGGTPNLVPYKPASWSDSILVQRQAEFMAGSTLDSTNLQPADQLYLSFAVANAGSGATTGSFDVDVYVDGAPYKLQFFHNDWPLLPSYYISWTGKAIGFLTGGTHTVRIALDSASAVAESNEQDNLYTKTITVQGAAPTPPPTTIPRMRVVHLTSGSRGR